MVKTVTQEDQFEGGVEAGISRKVIFCRFIRDELEFSRHIQGWRWRECPRER